MLSDILRKERLETWSGQLNSLGNCRLKSFVSVNLIMRSSRAIVMLTIFESYQFKTCVPPRKAL